MDAFFGFIIFGGLVWWWLRRRKSKGVIPKPTNRGSGKWPPPEVGGEQNNASGAAFVVKVKAGNQISLGVNTQHVSDEAIKQLVGSYSEDDIEKTVRLVVFRGLESQYKNSIRVETPEGAFVGWILKDDSQLACTVVDTVTRGVNKSFKDSKGKQVRLNVSASVIGTWHEDDIGDGKSVREAEIEEIAIQIKDPAEVDPE